MNGAVRSRAEHRLVDDRAVLALLRRRLGLRATEPMARRAHRAIRRAMDEAGTADAEAFAALLERDPELFAGLVDEIVVDESYFFRESGQLAELRGRILPELVASRPTGHTFRIWSAGCSTGEEAYSLAFLLDREGLGGSSRILATDVSRRALEAAREATYRRWSLRGVDEAQRSLFETTRDGLAQVPPRIAGRVEFARLNLVTDRYPSGGLDLVVCRNVLVYLAEAERRRVGRRLADSLAPGGWLLLASTDPTAGLDGILEVVRSPAGALYRRPGLAAAAIGPSVSSTDTTRGTGAPRDPDHSRSVTRSGTTNGHGEEPDVPAGAPRPPSTQSGHVAELVAAGRPDESLVILREAIVEAPFDADLRCLEGIVLLELGEPGAAAAAASAATYLAPSSPSGHLVLGQAELVRGDRAGALRAFRVARELLGGLADDVDVAVFGRSASELRRTAAALVDQLDGGAA